MSDQLNVEPLVRSSLPILFEFLGDIKLDWSTINNGSTRTIKERLERFKRQPEGFYYQTNLIDLLLQADAGNVRANTLKDFIRRLFEELASMLSVDEKKLLKANMFGVLTNQNLNYLNFIGELAILHRYKKNTGNLLMQTEIPTGEGTRVDFRFFDALKDHTVLVEVVNLHPDMHGERIWNDTMIANLLENKLAAKVRSKRRQGHVNFNLMPVLWGSEKTLRIFVEYYTRNPSGFTNIIIPCAYMSYYYEDGQVRHWFGTIDTLSFN